MLVAVVDPRRDAARHQVQQQCQLRDDNRDLGDQNMVRMDWFISNLLGGIKLQVKRDDVEEALALLDEEVPKSFEVEG